MSEYDLFTNLVPEELVNKIPENRKHHALWNLANLIQSENPKLYQEVIKENTSDEAKKNMTELIQKKWNEVMAWHVNNGYITNPDAPQEIKREPVPTDKEANKRILACVKTEYMKRIPFFVRKHANGKTCELIAREFPDLYAAFKSEPSEDAKAKMTKLINAIFAERMAKHNM